MDTKAAPHVVRHWILPKPQAKGGWQVFEALSDDTSGRKVGEFRTKAEAEEKVAYLNSRLPRFHSSNPQDARLIRKEDLVGDMKDLLESCGPDAQNHDLELDNNGILRFRANPIVKLVVDRWVDLNILWRTVDISKTDQRLGLRAFYRSMGYSLCGYIDVFGGQLNEEEHVENAFSEIRGQIRRKTWTEWMESKREAL